MSNRSEELRLREDLREAFYGDGAFKESPLNDKEPYVILVNGKRATLRSGKSIWANLTAAKNALRVHMDKLFRKLMMSKKSCGYDIMIKTLERRDYVKIRNIVKEEQDKWIEKHVVFVPYKEYSAMVAKIIK